MKPPINPQTAEPRGGPSADTALAVAVLGNGKPEVGPMAARLAQAIETHEHVELAEVDLSADSNLAPGSEFDASVKADAR